MIRVLRFLPILALSFSFLSFAATIPHLDDGDPLPGNSGDPIEWEPEQPEIIVDDSKIGNDVNANDLSQFDETLQTDDPRYSAIQKRKIDQYLTQTCETIRANRDNFPIQKIRRATQYYTPMFEPGENGRLQQSDRRSCINVEGSCIVGDLLYNWVNKNEPWGKVYERKEVKFKFGKGSGESYYNTTNALDPCRTVAADTDYYPTGTVIYVPSMRDKICPQSGKTIDGCFIVGDIGSAIKGQGRFDFFTGECANYNKNGSYCQDELNAQFSPDNKAPFYVIGRHNKWAKALREEVDLFINSNWDNGRIFP